MDGMGNDTDDHRERGVIGLVFSGMSIGGSLLWRAHLATKKTQLAISVR